MCVGENKEKENGLCTCIYIPYFFQKVTYHKQNFTLLNVFIKIKYIKVLHLQN